MQGPEYAGEHSREYIAYHHKLTHLTKTTGSNLCLSSYSCQIAKLDRL
jgi:hypothetical protein